MKECFMYEINIKKKKFQVFRPEIFLKLRLVIDGQDEFVNINERLPEIGFG